MVKIENEAVTSVKSKFSRTQVDDLFNWQKENVKDIIFKAQQLTNQQTNHQNQSITLWHKTKFY